MSEPDEKTPETTPAPLFVPVPELDGAEWCVAEMMGHRRHVGRVSEVERFGAKLCRVEVFCRDGHLVMAPQYGGAAIFGITPHPGGEVGCRKANGILDCPHPDHDAEKEEARARRALPWRDPDLHPEIDDGPEDAADYYDPSDDRDAR